MTIPTVAMLSLSFLGLFVSICALSVALRSSGRSLLKQLNALSQRVSDAEILVEAQNTRIKSIRSQLHAKFSRAANNEVPELTSETIESAKDRWTRETNLRIARGEIKLR